MLKEFTPYQLSKSLENLNLKVTNKLAFITSDNRLYMRTESYAPQSSIDTYLWQQVEEWFREEHRIGYEIKPIYNTFSEDHNFLGWGIEIFCLKYGDYLFNTSDYQGDWFNESYEDRRLECFKKIVEIIQKRNEGE